MMGGSHDATVFAEAALCIGTHLALHTGAWGVMEGACGEGQAAAARRF